MLRNHVTATRGKIWSYNPLHVLAGGHLRQPTERFQDPLAMAADARHRQYVVARWGDSPAILAWKLWSEQNLTRADRAVRTEWHRIAAAHLAEIDPYDHPVTTHWSGNLGGVEDAIARLDGLDMVVLNAYKTGDRDLDQMIWDTRHEPARLAWPSTQANHHYRIRWLMDCRSPGSVSMCGFKLARGLHSPPATQARQCTGGGSGSTRAPNGSTATERFSGLSRRRSARRGRSFTAI